MTPEQRLDRLERIAKLLANAGMRARRGLRRDVWNHDHKINYLADLQIKNEERFAKLAESQANTNQQLVALIDIIKNRNGGSLRNN